MNKKKLIGKVETVTENILRPPVIATGDDNHLTYLITVRYKAYMQNSYSLSPRGEGWGEGEPGESFCTESQKKSNGR